MKVAKYWARESANAQDDSGYRYRLVSWSGSNQDLREAKRKAAEKLKRWQAILNSGQALGDYLYQDKDEIKEELIKQYTDDNGNIIAAITRNRYGVLVLNSANVLFADVDLPAAKPASFLPSLLALFRGRVGPNSATLDLREHYRQKFIEFHRNRPDLALRVYETRAGFRLAVINQLFDPLSDETNTVLQQLSSDPLYLHLCRSQACFRARLTPKPWRRKHQRPPNQYPREDINERRRFEQWLQEYQHKSKVYGVCRPLDQLGNTDMPEVATAVINLHDHYVLNKTANENLA